MAFDVLDLRLFLAVVDHGSITHGAEAVHLSLPSASGRISAMEHALGARLLDRHPRGVSPTATGRSLLGHAREILDRHDRMRRELADVTGGHTVTITLLAITAAAPLLEDVVIAFLADNPGVDVDLAEQTSTAIVSELVDRRAELGVLSDQPELGRLDTVALERDPLVVVTRPDHHLAGSDGVAFADVVEESLVGYAQGRSLQRYLSTRAQPLRSHPRHRARFPDTAGVLKAVDAGVGIAILPARSAPDHLVAVPLRDAWADRTLLLATRDRDELSTPARRLWAALT